VAPFSRGLSPVETDLGECHTSGRRTEQSTLFPSANYRMIKRENLADQNRLPRILIVEEAKRTQVDRIDLEILPTNKIAVMLSKTLGFESHGRTIYSRELLHPY